MKIEDAKIGERVTWYGAYPDEVEHGVIISKDDKHIFVHFDGSSEPDGIARNPKYFRHEITEHQSSSKIERP